MSGVQAVGGGDVPVDDPLVEVAPAEAPAAHDSAQRLVAFSDAVFAVIITILVLGLRPPAGAGYSSLLNADIRKFMRMRAWTTLGLFGVAAVVALLNRMIASDNQHFLAERMGAEVRSHPVDHMLVLTAPEVVSESLLEVVRKVGKDLAQG